LLQLLGLGEEEREEKEKREEHGTREGRGGGTMAFGGEKERRERKKREARGEGSGRKVPFWTCAFWKH